jgi:hypothetical protein
MIYQGMPHRFGCHSAEMSAILLFFRIVVCQPKVGFRVTTNTPDFVTGRFTSDSMSGLGSVGRFQCRFNFLAHSRARIHRQR